MTTRGKAVTLNALVSQKNEVTPDLSILQIVSDGWELPAFRPGQFAVLGLPGSAPRVLRSDEENPVPKGNKLIRRAYSIASSSVNQEYMEFYITLVRSGALTPRLFGLDHGDPLHLGPKVTGMFTLEEVLAKKHIILVATGTGLAPYMSMLRTSLIPGDDRKFAVIHGARHSWDLGYRAELITLNTICTNLTYIPVVSRPAEEMVPWGGYTGHVQEIWEQDLVGAAWGLKPSPENTHIFLCGNPAMIEDMLASVSRVGYSEHTKKRAGTVHLERYW